jgi:hypothetical protein
VVSHSVDTAAIAAEACGATVERVRLYDLEVRYCTGCLLCGPTGICQIQDDLPDLVGRIDRADAVIFGTTGYFRKADDATRAVLDRLSGYFAGNGQMRLPGMSTKDIPQAGSARAVKRAVIITACAAPEPLATFFGYTTGPVRELRQALGSGGIRTIGSLSISDTWRHPEMQSWEHERAESLGRILAGKI